MKNELIPNEKSILAGIKKDSDGIKHHKKELVKYAISLGEKLINAKKLVPHGQWEAWLKSHSECDFGVNQAAKYMRVAANKELAILASENELLSLDELQKAISEATPEQLEKVEQLKAEAEEKSIQQEKERQEKIAQREAKKSEEETIEKVQTKEPEIIEGDFTEVKPTLKKEEPIYEPEETIEQVLTEANEILQADNQELVKEIDSVTKILESNDKVSAALAEAKKFRELNRVLNERITGLQNEKNEAIKTAKYWKNRAEKLERELTTVKAAA